MYNTPNRIYDELLVKDAVQFAAEAHVKQYRDDGTTPYFTHVEAVAQKVAEFTDDAQVISAAYLHDTMEDCGVTFLQLETIFGSRVATLVAFLTNASIKENERSQDVAKRRVADNARVAAAPMEVWLIKLCDRLHNLSSINNWDKKRVGKYIEKTEDLLLRIGAEAQERFKDDLMPVWLLELTNRVVEKLDELKTRHNICK